MLILYGVVGCITVCAIACAYLCIRRAGSTLASLLLHVGAALVVLLAASQYGVLVKADSLGVSEEVLNYCVYGICGICLTYFVLMLFICNHIQGCIAQCVLVTVVIILGCVGLLLEFGGVVSPIIHHHSQSLVDLILTWSPFQTD